MPSGSGCCSPASLPSGREGPICSQLALLWYSLNSVFCVWGSSLSRERFFLFIYLFIVALVIPRFGLLSHNSSLRLSSGHSGPVLALRTDDVACAFLPSPHLLVENRGIWATAAISCIFCEFFLFSFQLCYPERFQNSPQACL